MILKREALLSLRYRGATRNHGNQRRVTKMVGRLANSGKARSALIKCLIFVAVLGISVCGVCVKQAQAYTQYYSFEIEGAPTLGRAVFYGINQTHGYMEVLPYTLYQNAYRYNISVFLPDDGCTWRIIGSVSIHYRNYNPGTGGYEYRESAKHFDDTVTTSGTFTGYSPKTATDAANNAYTAANSAKTSADTAATNATNAYNAANNAYTAANDARSYTWDSSESKSAATLAKEARDKANDALAAINNIQTSLSENFSAITSLKLQGLNGATVTRNNSFSIIATSKQGVTYTAICNGPSNPVISISDNIITLNNISVPGAYTVTVTAVSGSASLQESITFFKI